MKAVQDRILGNAPSLDYASAKRLFNAIKSFLNDAYNSERLLTGLDGIHKSVQYKDLGSNRATIVGGVKDFQRRPENAQLVRSDGAWIHFSLTTATSAGVLVLEAYDFEIVFPADHVPPWVRIDLNPRDHENETLGIRSHLHPGNDDVVVPTVIMTPTEILEVFLGSHMRARDPDKPRT